MSKIRQHLKKHKTIYIAGGSSIFFAGITYLIMRDNDSQPIRDGISVPAQGGISVLGKKIEIADSVLNNVSYFSSNRQGPPSWVVRCLETGEVFTSQKEAAISMNIPASELSKHLNGFMDNVRGYTFERICMAA